MMCFYNDDYDWYADLVDVRFVRCDEPGHCEECNRKLESGEWIERMEQWEKEECHECGTYMGEEKPGGCVDGADCDFGEHYLAMTCADCMKMLVAIEAVEADEDCPPHSRRPSLGGMVDEVVELDDPEKYLARARAMFPGIESSLSYQRIANITEPV